MPGDAVAVLDSTGRLLGRGLYNPRTGIACRLLTRRDELVDAELIHRRLAGALQLRQTAGLAGEGYRLCWSEADGLPGLVVDRYGPVSVVQCQTLGMSRMGGWIAGAGLDVLQVEPAKADNPLLSMPHVVLSPHNASAGPMVTR